MVKLVKIITPFSGVRILPNYIIACRTGVFLLLLFSRFKLAKENAGGRGVRETCWVNYMLSPMATSLSLHFVA